MEKAGISIYTVYSCFMHFKSLISQEETTDFVESLGGAQKMTDASSLSQDTLTQASKAGRWSAIQKFVSSFLVLILLGLVLTLPLFSQSVRAEEDRLEDHLLALVNQARQEAGLKPVSLKAAMNPFVTVRAQEISSNFNHMKADGSSPFTGYPGTYMGENIQQNYARASVVDLATSVFNAFKASPSHWANILNPDWVYMGIGFYQAPVYTDGPYTGYAPAYICQWFSN